MKNKYLLSVLLVITLMTMVVKIGFSTGNLSYSLLTPPGLVIPIPETGSDTCEIPTNVQVSQITAQSATVSWTAPANLPGSGYAFEIRQSGLPGSGPAGLFTSGYTAPGITAIQVSGLSFNTQYYAYVRSNCGDNLYSEWTDGVPFLPLDPLELSAGLLHQSCFMSCDGAITLTVSGGLTPYAFQWSNGAVTPDIEGLCTDVYEVTVTDATLATVTGNWSIMAPGEISMIADANDISCYGENDGSITIESVEGGTPPYSFLWSNGATTTSLTGLSSGFYRVTVMDANECDIRTGTFIAEPDPIDGITTATPASCPWQPDGSIDLSVYGGTPPWSFLWSHGSTEEDPSDLFPGTYGVTITDYQQCEFYLSTIVPSMQPICGNAVVYGGTSETTCYDALQQITVAGYGNTFIVTGTGSATFIAGSSIVFLEGTTVMPGGYLHGFIAPAGPFCNTDEIVGNLNLVETNTDTGTTKSFLIRPNPTREDITIEPAGNRGYQQIMYEVYNAMGKHLFTRALLPGDYRAGISGLPAGLYFVRLHSGSEWETYRVIKTP